MMDVDRLKIDELNFELYVRGIAPEGNMDHKRKLLRSRLRIERSMPTTCPTVDLEPGEHLQACEDKLNEVEAELRDLVAPILDNTHRRLYTRLTHVHGRLDLLSTEGIFTAVKSSCVSRCLLLFEDLESKTNAVSASDTSSTEDLMQHHEPSAHPVTPNPTVDAATSRVRISTPVPEFTIPRDTRFTSFRRPSNISRFSGFPSETTVHVNPLAINKWGVQFNGESGLSSFLERIEELRVARGVSKEQLFTAAVELFVGNALIWYRSVRDSINSWEELISALRSTFLPGDYEYELWEEIRNRTQGALEPVAVYIAVMESLFRRLPSPPSECTRVTFIRRNLLPALYSQLATEFITTVSGLTSLCKTLEDAHKHAKKFKGPPAANSGLMEPDLAYRKPFSHLAAVHDFAEERSVLRPVPVVDAIAAPSRVAAPVATFRCWNCGESSHRSAVCPSPPRRHCYRCGEVGVTVRTCPKCSGNAVQRR